MFRGIAKGKRPKGFERPKDYLPVPMTEHLAVMNTQFWQDLPDILQAQVLVMLDTGKRTGRRNGWKVPTGESEVLLWAGTPHVRTRVLLQIFALWTVLLLIPVFVLVELVPDVGGMIALAWAVVSVFIFVPYLSRGSREVFALTTHRAFTSCRTMFCSIQSSQVAYVDVATAALKLHTDHTGSFLLRSARFNEDFPGIPLPEVRFDHVFDIKGASKILDEMLPADVLEASNLSGASGK
jgi:hypothetical protein